MGTRPRAAKAVGCGTKRNGKGCTKKKEGRGGECTHVIHGRNRMTIDHRIPTMPRRSTSGSHRPGRHCLHQARSAVRCWASRRKGEPHPTLESLSCIWMTWMADGGDSKGDAEIKRWMMVRRRDRHRMKKKRLPVVLVNLEGVDD